MKRGLIVQKCLQKLFMSVRDILNSLLEVKTTVTNKHEYERRCTFGRHAFWPIYMCAVFVYL